MRPSVVAALAALFLGAGKPEPQLEARLREVVEVACRRAGPVPTRDPRLDAAAAAVAARALAGQLAASATTELASAELSRVQGWDPILGVTAARSSPPERLPGALAERDNLCPDQPTHYGVGIASSGQRGAAVVLLAARRAELEPFSRQTAPGSHGTLEGRLLKPLRSPQVFVTAPGQDARSEANARVSGGSFSSEISFPRPGRYAIELLGTGPNGPEVAALFEVQVGEQKTSASAPRDLKSLAELLGAQNALRATKGLPPLARNSALDELALAHAERMATARFFAHKDPEKGSAAERLSRAGYSYQVVLENLAEGATLGQCERNLEASPAHLTAIVDREVTQVGLGAAMSQTHPGSLLLCELLVLPPRPSLAPAEGSDLRGEVLLQVLQERARRRLPDLARDTDLDRLAETHLARMTEKDDPDLDIHSLSAAALRLGPQMRAVAVDRFVGSNPEDALSSKNLIDHRYNRVGVAAGRATTSKFGPGRLWMVVVYARRTMVP